MKSHDTTNHQYQTLPITAIEDYLFFPQFIFDQSDSAPAKPVIESSVPTLAPLPGEYIGYRFRSFAQTVRGDIIHTFIIHSVRSVGIKRMDVIAMGEQFDFVVPLDYASVGNIYKNTVNGFTLAGGKNIMKVCFADNMRHAVKVRLFEEIRP